MANNEDRSNSNYNYSNGRYFPLPFHLQRSSSSSSSSATDQQYPKPHIQHQYNTPPIQLPPQAVKMPSAPSAGYSASVPGAGMYTLPQFQQLQSAINRLYSCVIWSLDEMRHVQASAQQLFQRDAQTITPEALESVKAALASSEIEHKAETKKKALPRKAAGQTWEDPTLAEWPENDYRLFCGDLGNEVNDDVLSKAFSRFPDFNMARVVRDKRTGKTRGYGFVSFSTPADLEGALKEMNGKYVGNRPIKLRKSTWRERTDSDALERQKYQTHKKPKLSKRSVLHK